MHWKAVALSNAGKGRLCMQRCQRFHAPACEWPHKEHHMSTAEVKKMESHWRDLVLKSERNTESRGKKYVLSMFPYPSGNLHMGHARIYAISDCLARYYALMGYKVIHPMGWDAFGLPAENAAIERKQSPEKWTRTNIEIMRQQLMQLGCRFDWDKEIATCDPAYYRWTQLIFLKLYEAGLAYQRESYVNWDPIDRTVLAEEQIDDEGRSWRSGAIVEKKLLRQWFVRATRFTKDLVDELANLSHWDDIVDIQQHWLGVCNVYKFWLPLEKSDGTRHNDDVDILVADPAVISRAVFLAIRPSHILNQPRYVAQSFGDENVLSLFAVNRLTGRRLPIVVSNRVSYDDELTDHYIGVLNKQSDQDLLKRLNSTLGCLAEDTALPAEAVLVHAKTNHWGGYLASRRLGDWVVSRQRYWGTPIPVVHCPKCKVVPVPEADLPVVLPKQFPSNAHSVDHRSPLAAVADWLRVPCPKCGGKAERETDTLDTFFDSSWYYLRYLDSTNSKAPFSRAKAEKFMPVDIYVGGKEHATLHLYYARVISHFLHSLGWYPYREPFQHLLPQGFVMGQAYQVKSTGQYIPQNQVVKAGNRMIDSVTKLPVSEKWEKMSKSKHNGVNPSDILEAYGVDMTRLLVMSGSPPLAHRNWDLSDATKLLKWIARVKYHVNNYIRQRQQALSSPPDPAVTSTKQFLETEALLKEYYNRHVRRATYALGETRLLNLAISNLTLFTSVLRKCPVSLVGTSPEFERCLHSLIIMISVFAPHFAAETWAAIASVPTVSKSHYWRKEEPVWNQDWPEFDDDARFDLEIWIQDDIWARIPIDRHLLKTLNAVEAFEFAMKTQDGIEVAQHFEWLKPKSIKYIENHGAELFVHGKKKKKQKQNEKKAQEV